MSFYVEKTKHNDKELQHRPFLCLQMCRKLTNPDNELKHVLFFYYLFFHVLSHVLFSFFSFLNYFYSRNTQ